jgi:predicted transcriptional regulator
MAEGAKTVTIKLTDEQHREIHDLARRKQTSVTVIGQYAIEQLLVRARKGRRIKIKPSTMENAVLTTVMGRELP